MSLSAKLRRAPLRVVTGAFVLNSGLGKLKADEDTAKALHGMASGTYGFLGNVDPKLFLKGLAVGEMALGGALSPTLDRGGRAAAMAAVARALDAGDPEARWSARLLAEQVAFVTATTHRGRICTRFAIINPLTSAADLALIVESMR